MIHTQFAPPDPMRRGRRDGVRCDRTLLVVSLLLGLAALGAASLVLAAPGDVDPTFAGFGDGGKLVMSNWNQRGMAVQPDEKIVIVQNIITGIRVRRLQQNGELDPSFSGDGEGVYDHPSFRVRAGSVAIQTDGKIVLAGFAETTPASFMLARLTHAGALDPTFDGDGWVTTDFANDSDVADGVLIQPDGKIIAGGWAIVDGDDDFAVARYLSNGALDNTFGGDGKVTIPFGGDDVCTDIELQEDGRLVLVGYHASTFEIDFAIARLNGNGSLDTSFDSDGKVTTGFGANAGAEAVAIQPDGKIIACGTLTIPMFGDANVARYLSNGALDNTFSDDGKMTTALNSCDDVAIQPDGKIVLFGTHESPDGDYKMAFHRLNPSGTLDTTFDGDGDAYIDFGDDDGADRVALLPDGRIIGCGPSDTNVALVRLCPDGSYDVGGRQTLAFRDDPFPPGSNENVYGMATQADGRIVVVGTVSNPLGTESDIALSRFLPNGVLDGSFGTAGRVAFSLSNLDVGRGVAIQPDGKIVVGGYTGVGNVQFLVARFLANGSIDASFGLGGQNVVDFANGPDYAHAVGIASDGKIVLAGSVFSGSAMVFGAARFNANGTVDTSFDGDGKQTASFPGASTQWASAAVVQPDRKIVVGGHANNDFALVRFNENGSLDGGFGTGGFTMTDMGGADAIRAMALDQFGRIYGAGGGGPNADFALAQYYFNGILFTCSPPPINCGWRLGKVYMDWGGAESAWAMDIRSDGRVVAAGCVNGLLGWGQVTISSPFNALEVTTDFVGDIQCETGGEFSITGAAGVQYLYSDRVLIAATQNYGGDLNIALASFEVQASLASDIGDDEESVDSARSARLLPAFPNPLVRHSTIAFDLRRDQQVQVRLYNAAGRVVRTLADGALPAGRHLKTWDGTDDQGNKVAAGVYFARLDAGGGTQERCSIVVLR
jgi:uncharacterized delta-60 repeat protein